MMQLHTPRLSSRLSPRRLQRAFVSLLLMSGGLAHADTPVGYVKTLSGVATITTAGVQTTARVGSSIYRGSELRTGAAASMGVTFKDNTRMSFGPDTALTVDEYLYNPSQNELRFDSRLARGTLDYVSGAIAKTRPEAVRITTPSGTIGVRGTHFLAKVESDE
jgi:hypothetical protein